MAEFLTIEHFSEVLLPLLAFLGGMILKSFKAYELVATKGFVESLIEKSINDLKAYTDNKSREAYRQAQGHSSLNRQAIDSLMRKQDLMIQASLLRAFA